MVESTRILITPCCSLNNDYVLEVKLCVMRQIRIEIITWYLCDESCNKFWSLSLIMT